MQSIKSINSEGMNHLVEPKIACILSLVQNPILHPSLFSLSHSSPFSCSLPPSPNHHFFPLPYPLLSLLVSLAYPFPPSLSSSLTCPPLPPYNGCLSPVPDARWPKWRSLRVCGRGKKKKKKRRRRKNWCQVGACGWMGERGG